LGPKCVLNSPELNSGAAKTPEIKSFDIIKDEKQKENRTADQFFSSLLERSKARTGFSMQHSDRRYSGK